MQVTGESKLLCKYLWNVDRSGVSSNLCLREVTTWEHVQRKPAPAKVRLCHSLPIVRTRPPRHMGHKNFGFQDYCFSRFACAILLSSQMPHTRACPPRRCLDTLRRSSLVHVLPLPHHTGPSFDNHKTERTSLQQ